MDKIPPSSQQPPKVRPPATPEKHSPWKSPRVWTGFIINVIQILSKHIKRGVGITPKETAIDKRSIQHIVENNDKKAFTLTKAWECERTEQFVKAAWLRAKANQGIYESPTEEWKRFRELGRGGEGRADLAFEGLAGKLEVKKTFFDPENRPDTEIKLLKRLDHPNIVKISPQMQGASRKEQGVHMTNGGAPLTGLVPTTTTPDRVSPKLFRSIASQLADSLAYLKEEKVQHRDIKPDNIVIDPTGHITLIDFGMAYDGETKTACAPWGIGTPGFLPPDVANYKKVGPQFSDTADMFATGQTLFALITGSLLAFPEIKPQDNQTEQEAWDIYKNDPSLLDNITSQVFPALRNEPPMYIAAVINLLKQMLHPDPDQRITPEEFQKHPLFTM